MGAAAGRDLDMDFGGVCEAVVQPRYLMFYLMFLLCNRRDGVDGSKQARKALRLTQVGAGSTQ